MRLLHHLLELVSGLDLARSTTREIGLRTYFVELGNVVLLACRGRQDCVRSNERTVVIEVTSIVIANVQSAERTVEWIGQFCRCER